MSKELEDLKKELQKQKTINANLRVEIDNTTKSNTALIKEIKELKDTNARSLSELTTSSTQPDKKNWFVNDSEDESQQDYKEKYIDLLRKIDTHNRRVYVHDNSCEITVSGVSPCYACKKTGDYCCLKHNVVAPKDDEYVYLCQMCSGCIDYTSFHPENYD
jgi:hypothetical protein